MIYDQTLVFSGMILYQEDVILVERISNEIKRYLRCRITKSVQRVHLITLKLVSKKSSR